MIDSKGTYKIFADFYDIYTSKFSDDLEFYKTYCSKTDKIIEIGCGTGRVLGFFLKSGYEITGIDSSREMLDKAESKLKEYIANKKLQLFNHDLAADKFPDRFDKAIISFYTFNYITDKPLDFLGNVYDLLNKNRMLLMDLFYPNSLYDKSIDDIWIEKEFEFEGRKIKIKDNRYVKNNIERRQQIYIIDDSETKIDTDRKYYSPQRIKELLEEAGFKNIELASGYDLNGFRPMIDESELKTNFIIKAEK